MVLNQTLWEQSLGPSHCSTDGSGFQGLHPCRTLSLSPLSVKWERLYLWALQGLGKVVVLVMRAGCSAESLPQPLGPQDQVLGARCLMTVLRAEVYGVLRIFHVWSPHILQQPHEAAPINITRHSC